MIMARGGSVADPNDVTNWTIAGVAGGGAILWLARWVVRTFHVDRLANKATDAEAGVIDRLQSEIKRLEEIIQWQGAEIRALQREMGTLHDVEVADAADLSMIAVLIDQKCDGKTCPCAGAVKYKLLEAVQRISERRKKSS